MARQNRLYGSNRKSSGHGGEVVGRTRSWLARFVNGSPEKVHRGRLQLEALERRQLMAGDVDLFASDGIGQTFDSQIIEVAVQQTPPSVAQPSQAAPAPDLVAFAELLGQLNVQFFGSDSCPECRQQRELFSDGGDNLPFIEVTNPDGSLNEIGIANNITVFPTFQFPSGQRLEGVQTLEALAAAAGVSIPFSDTPSFDAIGEQNVAIGSPLHVVVDAFDPGEGPVTTTVTVADPSLVEAQVIQGNRSIRIDVQNYGVLVFELFEGRAPQTTAQIIQLVESGFYDEQPNGDGIDFHRVIDNFVIQAGDPTGTGAGGSTLPDVDDEFHPDLQHNREGVLSFAKAGDDTNNSQFFITEGPTRNLDFNHSVLGQLVEGFDVREAISRIPTEFDANGNNTGRPLTPIRINSVEVFEDNENSLVLLRPVGNQTGTTTATVTTTDADGNTATETFTVNVVADTGILANSQPYLNPIAQPAATANDTSATLQLSSVDIEGDPVQYSGFDRTTGANIDVSVDSVTGLVSVTPPAGFVGTALVEVRVEWVTPAFAGQFDSQLLEFEFTQAVVADTLVFSAGQTAFVGNAYTNDVNLSGGDETGVTYTLVNPPAGATIDATTGVISLTPTADQVGSVAVAVAATRDGEVVDTGSFTLDILTGTASYRVELTNLDGTTVNSLISGQEFFATLILQDDRPAPGNTGVFAAAVDLTFDPDVIRPADGATIEFLQPLDDLNGGTIGDGIIDNVRGVSSSTLGSEQPINQFARIRFVALTAGTTTLQTASAADAAATLLLDVDNQISPSLIVFGSTTVSITNDLSITNDTFTVVEDSGATTLDVLGNDTQLIGTGQITVTEVTQPVVGGTVEIENGEVRFTPAANFVGDATFTYTASVAGGETGSASVTVTVTGVNDPPTANDDNFSVGANQVARTLDVLSNDSIAPDFGETLSITAVGTPAAGGVVVIANDGLTLIYTPPAIGEIATDTFTYTISDGVQTATATVMIDLDVVPTAVDDTFTLAEDTTTDVDPLANDIADPDGQTFTIVSLGTPSSGGDATIIDNGARISYTPSLNFVGAESLTYTIRDSGGGESTATIIFNVTPVNDAPPAGTFDRSAVRLSSGNGNGNVGQTVLSISDLAANVDANEVVQFQSATIGNAATGTLSVSAQGTELIFLPSSDLTTSVDDVITFVTIDTDGLTSTGTINLRVNDFELRRIIVQFQSTNTATLVRETGSRLVGTTIQGDAISVEAIVAADGSISFPSVAPGNYEVVVPANPFLQGRENEQRIAINSGLSDGDATVSPTGGLLRPEFVSVQDFLGSTSRSSVLVAVEPGANSILTLSGAGQTVTQLRGSLDANGNQLTLQGVDSGTSDPATGDVSTQLPTTGNSRVQSRGRVGNVTLYRVDLDDSGSLFTPSAATSVATSASSPAPAALPAIGSPAVGAGANGAASTMQIDEIIESLPSFDDGLGTNNLPVSGATTSVNSDVNDEAIFDVFGGV